MSTNYMVIWLMAVIGIATILFAAYMLIPPRK
jgi:hypothetical protein